VADGIDGRAGCGAQKRALAVLVFNFDLTQFSKVIEDALPFQPLCLMRGETVHQLFAQQERKEFAEHVTADAGIGFVEDGPRRHQCLCHLESVFHGQQIAIAQHYQCHLAASTAVTF
jgi:hypothetical protein